MRCHFRFTGVLLSCTEVLMTRVLELKLPTKSNEMTPCTGSRAWIPENKGSDRVLSGVNYGRTEAYSSFSKAAVVVSSVCKAL